MLSWKHSALPRFLHRLIQLPISIVSPCGAHACTELLLVGLTSREEKKLFARNTGKDCAIVVGRAQRNVTSDEIKRLFVVCRISAPRKPAGLCSALGRHKSRRQSAKHAVRRKLEASSRLPCVKDKKENKKSSSQEDF